MRSTLFIRSVLLAALACAASVWCAEPPSITAVRSRSGLPEAAPGDVVEISGTAMANTVDEVLSWPLPDSLAGTEVFCGTVAVPVLAVAPNRVRIQLPWELPSGRSVDIVVRAGGVASVPFAFKVETLAPSVLGIDRAIIEPGGTMTVFGTGLGLRMRNPATGTAPSAELPGTPATRMYVMIGGVPAPATGNQLRSNGNVQEDAGVQAITVSVPSNVPAGESIPVEIRTGFRVSEPYSARVSSIEGVQVKISPTIADLPLGATLKFAVEVAGSSESGLAWSTDAAYDMPNTSSAIGSVSAGFLSAVGAMPSPPYGIVKATHKSGAFATALVRLVARDGNTYRIVPENPVIAAGETVAFTLLDASGAPVSGASWYVSDGFGATRESSYTAPAQFPQPRVKVSARLVVNGYSSEAATTTILVLPPRIPGASTNRPVAHVGQELGLDGVSVSVGQTYFWFPTSSGSRLRVRGNAASVVVPHGAVSGLARLEMQSTEGFTALSEPFRINVLPQLRVRASRLRVASGETVQITATTPDSVESWPLDWRADLGVVDPEGRFTAPAASSPAFARVWACIKGTVECGTTVLKVLPFRLEPDPLILNPGERALLQASEGGRIVAATWKALTTNVTVAQDGAVTAGSGPFDGGKAIVSGSLGNVELPFEISIRSPGVATHTAEYNDWLGADSNDHYGRLALGAFAGDAVVRGDWIYALCSNSRGLSGPWYAIWIDVYRLDERRVPVWITSVEGLSGGKLLVEGGTLYVSGREGDRKLLLTYDVSTGIPELQGRLYTEVDWSGIRKQGLDFAVEGGDSQTGSSLALRVTDYSAGSTRRLPIRYTPLVTSGTTAAGTATWAAVQFDYGLGGYAPAETVVFDITGSSADPIAVLPSGGFNHSMAAMENVLFVGGDVYQISGREVTPVAQLPYHFILSADTSNKRLLVTHDFMMQRDGYRVIDLNEPANPRISAATAQQGQANTWGVLGPDYFVLAPGPHNLGIYPIWWGDGAEMVDRFPASPAMNDLRMRDGFLYWTGYGFGVEGRSTTRRLFEVVDLSSKPFRTVAAFDRPGDHVGWAVELNGHYAYVGTDAELIVYDITSPSRPVELRALPSPAVSLAVLGRFLYVGSNEGSSTRLLIYDISDPALPRLANSLPLPDFAYSLAAQPGWLAVATGKQGLRLYSLAQPEAPAVASTLSYWVWGVAGNRNTLYAAADSAGLAIFDVTRLTSPAVVSVTDLGSGVETFGAFYPNAMSVSLDERGIAWLTTTKDHRVYGLDVRTRSNPRHVFEFQMGIGIGSAPNAAAWNGTLVIGGDVAAFDTTHAQNIGLYQADHSDPYSVLPPRESERAANAKANDDEVLPPKARALRRMEGRPSVRREEPR